MQISGQTRITKKKKKKKKKNSRKSSRIKHNLNGAVAIHPSMALFSATACNALSITVWAFLDRDNHILNGPLGHSPCLFARSAPLRLLGSQARSFTSLTPSWDSWNSWICIHAMNMFHGKKRVFGHYQKHALTHTHHLNPAVDKLQSLHHSQSLWIRASVSHLQCPSIRASVIRIFDRILCRLHGRRDRLSNWTAA